MEIAKSTKEIEIPPLLPPPLAVGDIRDAAFRQLR